MELLYVDGPFSTSRVPPSLQEAVEGKILEIKAEAERRITSLDWRLQRALEREQLGVAGGFETAAEVLELREQVRQASNASESVVLGLQSVEEVLSFSW